VSTRIWALSSPGEVRVAVAEGDRLLDYAIWRPGAPDGVGDLHMGRVSARAPALGGSFVVLDGVAAGGFLPDSQAGRSLTEGELVAVRVTRAAQGGKGPRLTALVSDGERAAAEGAVRLVSRGPGAVARLAALHGDAEVLTASHALAAALRPALGARIRVTAEAPGEALMTAIDALARPELELPGGLRLSITPTPALVAIDMDTGSAGGDRSTHGPSGHGMAANLALLRVLADQIRLRNLSGAILVDFAGLPVRKRAALGPALAAALADDPLAPRLLGFTRLGLAEIVRTRVHPPLHELLAGPHAAGLAALRHLVAEAAQRPHARMRLRAAPAVCAALQGDAVALPAYAELTGRPLALRPDPALAAADWRMEEA
jgi:Ribonuclease G/E